MSALYAPGARVVIRDCEWVVRRADPSDDGGYVLTVDGLPELVNGKSARFLSQLEEQAGAIRVLDPAKTPLLNRVTFSNETLQQVIQSMSLTRPAKGETRRGRVSYTKLGINQLGAVYEAKTFYDQSGRIAFTPSKGQVGVGLPRKVKPAELTTTARPARS